MKKLYNKALMFQSFYIGKWALLLSCFFFGFISYIKINNDFSSLARRINNFENNSYFGFYSQIRLISWGILLFLYIIITGISKRNNMIFLTSGPYTKSDIKKNEILFLFISLCALIVVFGYISLCLYYRHSDIMSISYGYARETFREMLKMFICGIAFISYLSIMDSLFANIGITVFLMISTPFIIMFDLVLLASSLDDLKCTIIFDNKLTWLIGEYFNKIQNFVFESVKYFEYNSYFIIFIIIVFTIIFFTLTKYVVKKLAINNTNKFFNFPWVENTFIWCLSISIIIAISYIIVHSNRNRSYVDLSNYEATFSLSGIVYIAVVIFISYVFKRILKKQIKKII